MPSATKLILLQTVKTIAETDNAGMSASLGDVSSGYDLFANKDEIEVNFLLMGAWMHN